jgi:hypothetical protein
VARKHIEDARPHMPRRGALDTRRAECFEKTLLEQLIIEALGTFSDVRSQRRHRIRRQAIVEVVPHVQHDLAAPGSG